MIMIIGFMIMIIGKLGRELGGPSMIFNSPKVQKYILSGARFVATIRKSGYYHIGKWVVIRVGDKWFDGQVIAVEPVTPLTLRHYVRYSGFGSIEEWITEAMKLHKGEIYPDKFMIIVVKVICPWRS